MAGRLVWDETRKVGCMASGTGILLDNSDGLLGVKIFVLAVIAVVLAVLAASWLVGRLHGHADARARRRFYRVTAGMWSLAARVSGGRKDDDPDTRLARAGIKRFQLVYPKLSGYDDPRLLEMASSLYELLDRYRRASGDERTGRRLDAERKELESTGLW